MVNPEVGNADIARQTKRRGNQKLLGGFSVLVFGAASIFGLASAASENGDTESQAIQAQSAAHIEHVDSPTPEKKEVNLSPEAIKFITAAYLHDVQTYIWNSTAHMLDVAYQGRLDVLAMLETGQDWTDTTGTFTGGIGVMQQAYAEHRDPDMPENQGDASPAVQKIVAYRIAQDVAPHGTFRAHKWSTAAEAGLP